jgi:hypothetical protein
VVVVVFVVAADFLAGAFTSFEQPVIKAKQAMQNKLCKIIFFIAQILTQSLQNIFQLNQNFLKKVACNFK